MPFKIHLLIISVIIILVYVIIRVFNTHIVEPEQSALPVTTKTAYVINVSNASWGMNCLKLYSEPRKDDEKPANALPLNENNVIYPVSRLCNGKSKCDIPVDSNSLGEPMVGCPKTLEIEYRCFNIDRLRKATAKTGTLTIDCDRQFITNNP